jgi:DNA mismatch repair protein MutS
LSNNLPRVKNYNVSVKEINNEIIFLRKLIPGGTEHSFGINVAQLAGMPNQILLRAYQLLERLEKKNLKEPLKSNDSKKVVEKQLTFLTLDPRFEKCRKLLTDVNINEINPLQALVKLNEMIEILKSNKK